MIVSKKRASLIFLSGNFISSLGSTAFVIGLLSFPIKSGISPAIIGLTIGIARIVGVLSNLILGPLGDRLSPIKLLFVSEIGAMICSSGIYFLNKSWSDANYLTFIVVVGLRSIFTAAQAASVRKVGKEFDDSLSLSGLYARYLNKASSGSIFFSMGICLLFLEFGSFSGLILFDAATFLINGFLVALLIRGSLTTTTEKIQSSKRLSLVDLILSNAEYIKRHKKLSQQDILLAVAMMGANTLNVILLFQHPKLIPIASGVFGLAVWLSTPIERALKPQSTTVWIALGFALALQGIVTEYPAILLSLSFVRNCCYWILFHRFSEELMKSTPSAVFASVSAGREAMISIVGALGEFWVGSKVLSVAQETSWRGICSFIGALPRFKLRTKIGVILLMLHLPIDHLAEASVLRMPISTLAVNTDPQMMEDVASLLINRQIHKGLMRYSTELELQTDLAESYTIEDSGKNYRFKLKSATFSDGSPIDAKSVVSSFYRLLKKKAAIAEDLKSVIGFDQVNHSNEDFGILAISPNVVEFKLRFSDPFFLKNLAAVDCAIIKVDENNNILQATSGNYIFSSTESEIILKIRNQIEKRIPHEVKFFKFETDLETIAAAKSGLIDSLEAVDVPTADRELLYAKGWHSFKGQVARLLFLSANPKILNSKKRKLLGSIFFERLQNPPSPNFTNAYGLIPSVLGGSLSKEEVQLALRPGEKLSASKKLEGFNKVKLSYPESDELKTIAIWIAEVLKGNGINVELISFPFSEYFKVIKTKKYELVLRTKYMDYPDGMSLLTYFKSNIAINTFNVGTKVTDKLIEAAQRETDNAKRIIAYKNIQLELLKSQNIIPLFNGASNSSLWSENIKTIKAHPMGLHSLYFNEIELKK